MSKLKGKEIPLNVFLAGSCLPAIRFKDTLNSIHDLPVDLKNVIYSFMWTGKKQLRHLQILFHILLDARKHNVSYVDTFPIRYSIAVGFNRLSGFLGDKKLEIGYNFLSPTDHYHFSAYQYAKAFGVPDNVKFCKFVLQNEELKKMEQVLCSNCFRVLMGKTITSTLFIDKVIVPEDLQEGFYTCRCKTSFHKDLSGRINICYYDRDDIMSKLMREAMAKN